MIDSLTARQLAAELHMAEQNGQQVKQISLRYPDISIDEAYAIQQQWIELKQAEGQCIRGHKIGLTSRAMQQASQIDEPDYGTLLDRMFYANGADIPMADFIDPKVVNQRKPEACLHPGPAIQAVLADSVIRCIAQRLIIDQCHNVLGA